MKQKIVQELEAQQLRKEPFKFSVGDTVSVHQRIIEGEKERIQVFTGTVIAKKGSGISETFTVHRVSYGEGMERVFMLNSPRIASIKVMRRGRVRRAKLNYLREATGKAAKVRESIGGKRSAKEAENNVAAAVDEVVTE
jgi:large subunit ribosomal protein L19